MCIRVYQSDILNDRVSGTLAPATTAYLENLYPNERRGEGTPDELEEIERILDEARPNSRLIGEVSAPPPPRSDMCDPPGKRVIRGEFSKLGLW